jgi:hypothetical protein
MTKRGEMTMKQNLKRLLRKSRHGRRDRGSALLVSLMVMVGLSLLGLSFVAISETENAISVNERNKTQTTAVAEAGAKAVVQWFQDPSTMNARGLLPGNDPQHFKNERLVSAYKGYYKPAGLLFDTPYGPQEQDLLYGDEDHADVLIVAGRNKESDDFLESFNKILFYEDSGAAAAARTRITAIRVYSPPNVGGNLVNGFWVAGQRYGVATVAVTAEKRHDNGDVIAQAICRLVVAPFPLPGPSGAIQSIGGIDTNGAYEVHWGSVESEQTATNTFIKRESTSFPWFDAYDRPYFEHGLDSSMLFQPNFLYTGYQAVPASGIRGVIVRPTTAAVAAKHEYEIVEVKGTAKSGAEPGWDQTPGNESWYGGDVKYREVTPTAYPIGTGAGTPYTNYNTHVWLSELLRRSVQDPWFTVRTKGRIDGKDTGLAPLNDPHPTDYATESGGNLALAGNYTTLGSNKSHYFQYQTYDNRPMYRAVRVPRFDYDFWKAAAVTGRGQKNVYYLEWVDTNRYTNGAETKTFENWIATGPGFFFFETKNKMNPQKGGPGVLVPIDASVCGAKGVIYMNTKAIKTTACDAVDGYYNQPGEPYRDIGYRKVNEVSTGMQQKKYFTTDGEGKPVRDKAYNNKWDYQDLEWSNGAGAKNGTFDVCMAQRKVYRESTNAIMTEWLPLPYFPNCKVGNNFSLPSCDCSEPHEPYLNLHYAGTKENIQAYWDDPNAASSVYAKVTNNEKPTGSPEPCTGGAVSSKAGQERCSTNAYDRHGALALLNKTSNESAVSVEGVVYNEGNYESTGNTAYFGSVVVAGVVSPNGTQEIWYDACLAEDCWPPKHIPFPRVMITSTQIQ